MNLKWLDPIYVVALAVAALLVLFPPWFERTGERDFLGLRPLFAPPRYTVSLPDPPRAPLTAPFEGESLRQQLIERREQRALLEKLRYPTGQLGYGVLATELLALGVVTITVATFRRSRPGAS